MGWGKEAVNGDRPRMVGMRDHGRVGEWTEDCDDDGEDGPLMVRMVGRDEPRIV